MGCKARMCYICIELFWLLKLITIAFSEILKKNITLKFLGFFKEFLFRTAVKR